MEKVLEKVKSLKIKRGKFEIVLDRRSIFSVDPTYDGIVFNFQEGLHLTCVDSGMPNTMKELIKNSINSLPSANLVVDLLNYSRPIHGDVV